MELGIGAPREGLYIREDVRMKCNIMMISFVKKTFKESHSKMVDRLVERAHVVESRQANERLNQLREVAPGERMGHGDIFIAPPPGYADKPGYGYEDKPLPDVRQSLYSNGSGQSQEPSPGLSQASTLTSQSDFPRSPPQQYQSQHQYSQSLASPPQQYAQPLSSPPQQYPPYQRGHSHSHSQDCDHRGSFQFGLEQQKAAKQAQNQQAQTLPSLSYLPSTVYNPHQPSNRDSQFHAFQPQRDSELLQPPPAELPAHMQDSPTLPRDLRRDQDKHIAELPA